MPRFELPIWMRGVSTIDASGNSILKNQHEIDIRDKSWKRIKQYALERRYDRYHVDMVLFHGIVDPDEIDITSSVLHEFNCIDDRYRNCLFKNGKTLEWYIVRPY